MYGLPAAQRAFPPRVLEILVALGVMIYGGTGLLAIALGGNLLGYDFLSHEPEHGQHLGILLVELGVGTTVTAVMVTLFYQFAGRARA
jgi:multicomponent Na+:H+ antiporter subunit B